MRIFLVLLLSGCAGYEFPREKDGRIDEEALKREVDIEITERLRLDTENGEILFECKVKQLWCVAPSE